MYTYMLIFIVIRCPYFNYHSSSIKTKEQYYYYFRSRMYYTQNIERQYCEYNTKKTV